MWFLSGHAGRRKAASIDVIEDSLVPTRVANPSAPALPAVLDIHGRPTGLALAALGIVYGGRAVLYCASGGRSALAAQALKDMGFDGVAHVKGGFPALRDAGVPLES